MLPEQQLPYSQVLGALNVLGQSFGMRMLSLDDFTQGGFDGRVWPSEGKTPRDRSVCLEMDNTLPGGILDVRHWGMWERDPEADWDEEDDDWAILSEESGAKVQVIVNDAKATIAHINPKLTVEWETGEKNHIDFTVVLTA
jgi:hypothetical protein